MIHYTFPEVNISSLVLFASDRMLKFSRGHRGGGAHFRKHALVFICFPSYLLSLS